MRINEFNNYESIITNHKQHLSDVFPLFSKPKYEELHISNITENIPDIDKNKIIQKWALDNVSNLERNISLETRNIIINFFDIFDSEYDYKLETDNCKLKLHFLKEFINVSQKWKHSTNDNTHKINKFNEILKKIDMKYEIIFVDCEEYQIDHKYYYFS